MMSSAMMRPRTTEITALVLCIVVAALCFLGYDIVSEQDVLKPLLETLRIF